jgi:hypothetical protein
MDILSLGEAARKIGIATLAKAIKSGRLFFSRRAAAQRRTDRIGAGLFVLGSW